MRQHDDQNGDEPTPEPQVPEQELLSEEELAEMTGFTDESEELNFAVKETASVPSSIISTKRDVFALGARTAIIASASLVIVLPITFGGQIFSTIFGNQPASRPVVQKPKPFQKKDSEDDIASLKTKIALTDQRALIQQQTAQLRKLNNKVVAASSSPAPSATPTVKSTSMPVAKPTNTTESKPAPVPRVIRVTVPATPTSKYELPTQTRKTAAQPKTPVSSKAIQTASVPVRPTIFKPNNSTAKIAKPKTQVPPTEVVSVRNDGFINTDQNKSTNKPKKTKSKVPDTASSPSTNHSVNVKVGIRTNAKLISPITLSANDVNSDNSQFSTNSKLNKNVRTYIKLTDDLKNLDGTKVLPKGTLLTVQLKSVTAQGWVNLSAVSIITRTNTEVTEKPVPQGAISVQKSDGSPLKAELITVPQLANNTDSKASIAISKTRNLPVRHGIDPNHNESARRKITELKSNLKNQPSGLQIRSYTLEKGALVQIYVNRSFSI